MILTPFLIACVIYFVHGESGKTIHGRSDQIARKSIHKRQDFCIEECASLAGVLFCSTLDCFCPIWNSASPSFIESCAVCLEGSSQASNITLLNTVCSRCESPCNATGNALLQTAFAFCDSVSCSCPYLEQVDPSSITECASCVGKYERNNATALMQAAEECGIISPSAEASFVASLKSGSCRVEINLWGMTTAIAFVSCILGPIIFGL